MVLPVGLMVLEASASSLRNIPINYNHNINNSNGINRSSSYRTNFQNDENNNTQDIIIEGIVVDNDDILEFEEDWEEFVEQLQQM
ncbi:18199_t:CDS:2 [Entrophospora sp. SA101]|nr:18199_t:CDS:2 [Entrophospora sp. SA101]